MGLSAEVSAQIGSLKTLNDLYILKRTNIKIDQNQQNPQTQFQIKGLSQAIQYFV